MLRGLNFYSIKSKLTACFLMLGLFPVLIFGFFSYRYYLENLQKNTTTYSFEVIERIDKNIETYISDIINILQLRNDYYILQYLKLNEAGDIDGNRKYTVRIWENFNSLKRMKSDLADIRVISHAGQTISCYGSFWTDISQEPLYDPLIKKATEEVSICPPYVDALNRNIFTIGKTVNASALGGQGLMCIDIDVGFLNKICNDIKLGEEGYVYLAEKNGDIVYLPVDANNLRATKVVVKNPKLINYESGSFTDKINGTNYIITFKTSQITGWKIIGVSPEAEMFKDISKVSKISLLVIISIIFIVLLLTLYLTNILTNPIRELRSLMKRASENDLTINANIKTRDEIGQLANSFNKMMNKIRDLMDKIVDDQLKIRKMEMKAMQELIKPHFVYNTLDSIIGLLEQNRNEDAMNLVESLGRFFRTSLSHGKEVVPIREEIDHVRSYLLIQQFRFSNKFDYLFELEDDIYKYKTIKLILQPLVENAIYHGVRGMDKKGLIIIKGYVRQEQILFEVIDNGAGMTEGVLEHINSVLSHAELIKDEDEFFGIRNVNERIKLNFGSDCGLWYVSKNSIGTKAVINIPLID